MTMYEVMEKIASLKAAIAEDGNWLVDHADDPATEMKAIEEKQSHMADLQKRCDIYEAQRKTMEDAQKSRVKAKAATTPTNDKDAYNTAKGMLYKAAFGQGKPEDVYAEYGDILGKNLGAIPAGSMNGGEHLLPTNMSNELIMEPFEDNSLRTIEQVSQITGLEEPRLLFDITDEALEDVTDAETANEIRTEGDTVEYGRYKTKIVSRVKDTVLNGTPLALQAAVDNGLRSGLAKKEKMRAFATAAKADHQHMSFYMNGIKAVSGASLLDAIIAAYGDLPDSFAENAVVVMRRADYTAMIRELQNNAATLHGTKPEDIIGIPVKFNSSAVIPVVGDFRYARLNYDIATTYDTDKDVLQGDYLFVLTAWMDHRIKLKSAFRLAIVGKSVIGGTITAPNDPPKKQDVLTAVPLFNDGVTPGTGIAYAWEYLNGKAWAAATAWTGNDTNALTTKDTDSGVSFRCKITYTDGQNTSTAYTNVAKLAKD